MHVTLVSSDCVPNPGGVAAHVFNLARALHGIGIKVSVIGGCQAAERLASFEPPFPEFQVRHIGSLPKLASGTFALWARRRIRRVMAEARVDVAHIHSFPVETLTLAGLGGRVRRVVTNHTSGFLDIYDAGRRRRLLPLLLGNYDAVIAPSRELEEKSTYLGVPRERIHYIPNGVDTERFSPGPGLPEDWERIAPFTEEHQIVLATRRLARKNGVHILVAAMPDVLKRCPQARLVLAGDGPERGALEVRVRSRKLDSFVRFLGSVPNPGLLGLYRLADVCVLPSLQEATSISGLEAMACAKPLVGTRVGGIPEILQDGIAGILVEPNDPEALAEGLSRLLADRELAAEMGVMARRRACDTFSWPGIARKTLAVYERCLKSRSP